MSKGANLDTDRSSRIVAVDPRVESPTLASDGKDATPRASDSFGTNGRSWFATVRSALRKVKADAETIAAIMKGIEGHDRDGVVDDFARLVGVARTQLDKTAMAHTVGLVTDVSAGVRFFRGKYLKYVRAAPEAPTQLHVGAVRGVGARIAVGGELRAFCASEYGQHAELSRGESRWAGAEAGLGPVAIAALRGDRSAPSAHALAFWLGLGVSVGPLPISGLSLLRSCEHADVVWELTDAQTTRVEEALSEASDFSRFHRAVDRLTARVA